MSALSVSIHSTFGPHSPAQCGNLSIIEMTPECLNDYLKLPQTEIDPAIKFMFGPS